MSSPAPAACTHELRPGTVVCLHCRHEARLAADAQRNRFLARVGGGVLAAAVVIGGAVAALRAMAGDVPAVAATADAPAAAPAPAPAAEAEPAMATETMPPAAFTAATPGGARVTLAAATTALPVPPAAAPVPPARAGRGPIVAEGRTALGEGVVAVRVGDTVAVHFDTPLARTRRHDKFERIVRATLPAVFGALADSALRAVPPGTLSRGADLLTELPTRGVHLPTTGGATLALWPATRPGRDGPLVVAYRATLLR